MTYVACTISGFISGGIFGLLLGGFIAAKGRRMMDGEER